MKEQLVLVAPEKRVGEGADADGVDLPLANIAQTSGAVNEALIRALKKYRRVFPVNPKIVPGCNRAKLQLPLTAAVARPTRQTSDGIPRRKRS